MFNDFEMIDIHWAYYDYIQRCSELGLIRKGWKPITMADFIDTVYPKLVKEREKKE